MQHPTEVTSEHTPKSVSRAILSVLKKSLNDQVFVVSFQTKDFPAICNNLHNSVDFFYYAITFLVIFSNMFFFLGSER